MWLEHPHQDSSWLASLYKMPPRVGPGTSAVNLKNSNKVISDTFSTLLPQGWKSNNPVTLLSQRKVRPNKKTMSGKVQTIPLGFEVGSGEPVAIPLKHLCITGQTQESGKTTTLEALITRSGLRAIAFITKRGEGSFDSGTAILPYFQERADWEFVESILESTMKQRMKFERAWVVKACRGAHSLADVQANCQELGAKARRSMDQDLFMLLNEYMSKVVPLVASLPKSPTLVLHPGLNVMDLSGYPDELQSLVISSAIRWVHKHEQGVITIIPEAWKFCPQGRKTPVYVEVKKLAREGAGLKNYIWIDSQDLAGVEKEILRACAVWLLGVQREANEIERALANIPKGVKRPKVGEIPSLKLGQFFTCFGDQVLKVYVQPAWASELDAREVAMGHRIEVSRIRKEQKVDYKALYETEKSERERIQRELTDLQRQFTEFTRNAVHATPAAPIKVAPVAIVPPLAPGKVVVDDPEQFKGPLPQNFEEFYQLLKKRIVAEAPALLAQLTRTVPEIEVTLEREKIEFDTSTVIGRVCYFITQGGLNSGKAPNEIQPKLEEAGLPAASNNIAEACRRLVEKGFLRKTGNRYFAVEGMKVNLIQK